MKQKHNKYTSTILSLFYIYIFLILILAWTPGNKLPDNISNNTSSLSHFIEFFGLGIITLLFSLFVLKEMEITKFFSIGLILGIITEVGQIFVPGRSFALNDLLANFAGFFIVPVLSLMVLEIIILKINMEIIK